MNLSDIPADVLAAADLVSDWFESQGISVWELGGLRSRGAAIAEHEDAERFRVLQGRVKASISGVMLDDTSRLQQWRQAAGGRSVA